MMATRQYHQDNTPASPDVEEASEKLEKIWVALQRWADARSDLIIGGISGSEIDIATLGRCRVNVGGLTDV